MKEITIRMLAYVLRVYYMRIPLRPGKKWVWDRIVVPHILWRPYRTAVQTAFGSRIGIDFRDTIQRYIFFFGIWEPVITRYVTGALRPGDIFIDVGANI